MILHGLYYLLYQRYVSFDLCWHPFVVFLQTHWDKVPLYCISGSCTSLCFVVLTLHYKVPWGVSCWPYFLSSFVKWVFLPWHYPHNVSMTRTIIGVCTSFALSMFLILLSVGDIAFSFSVYVLPLSIIGGLCWFYYFLGLMEWDMYSIFDPMY